MSHTELVVHQYRNDIEEGVIVLHHRLLNVPIPFQLMRRLAEIANKWFFNVGNQFEEIPRTLTRIECLFYISRVFYILDVRSIERLKMRMRTEIYQEAVRAVVDSWPKSGGSAAI